MGEGAKCDEDGGEAGAENASAMLPSLLPLLAKESYRQNLIRLMNLQRSKLQNVGLGFDVLITVIHLCVCYHPSNLHILNVYK